MADLRTSKRILAFLIIFCVAIFSVLAIQIYNYRKLHGAAEIKADDLQRATSPPRWDGSHPCVFSVPIGLHTAPTLGRCATPTTHTSAIDRFEVDLRYGSFVLRQSDLYLNDVFDVPLTRSYTSGDWNWTGSTHVRAFGVNSNHPYDVPPRGSSDPYTFMELALEDGDLLYFKRISDGTGYANAVYMHTETSSRFYRATLSWNGNGWTVRLTDGSQITYPDSYKAATFAQGAPTEFLDAAGNKLVLERDAQRNLQQILTPHNHWIKFTYDTQSRITQAQDDAGNSVKYAYNSDGLLISAVSSSGKERHYEYQDDRMTMIRDEAGHVLLHNTYAHFVVVGQEYANGDVYSYDYEWSANRMYAKKVTVTLPDHTTQEVNIGESVPEDILNPKPN
jgi:YD repeat-containing protein